MEKKVKKRRSMPTAYSILLLLIVAIALLSHGIPGVKGASLADVVMAIPSGFLDAIDVCVYPDSRRLSGADRRHRSTGGGDRACCEAISGAGDDSDSDIDVSLLNRRNHLRNGGGDDGLLRADYGNDDCCRV